MGVLSRLFLTLLLLLLGLPGCAALLSGLGYVGMSESVPPPAEPPTTQVGGEIPAPLLDAEWKAVAHVTVAGRQPISGESTITFNADGRANVTTPCNTGSGAAVFEDETLIIDQLITTKKACVEEELVEAERQFLEVLSHPLTWSVNNGELTLTPQDVSDSGLILEDQGS